MSIVEFYEALARIAEEANLEPFKGIYNEEDMPEWTYENRKNQILAHKLEAFIIKIFYSCSDGAFV